MDLEVTTTVNNTARRIPGDDKSFNEMENVKQKMAELCEAVAAKGGNVIIIGDVKDTEFQTLICQMQGKGRALAMDMARIAHRKDGEPIRGIMEAANMMLEITEKVTEVAAADAEVTNETTEE